MIVKPLFGAMGAGMTRVDDRDVAYRVFHALEIERAVYYLQETLPAERDVRAFVVGGRVLAAIERVGEGWRANLARGAEARPTELSAEQERLCLAAAEALGADYAGVDLLGDHVLELNGIPGWHGLQTATGVDVAAALVAHVESVRVNVNCGWVGRRGPAGRSPWRVAGRMPVQPQRRMAIPSQTLARDRPPAPASLPSRS